MAKIFISYRRADSRLVTNRIYDRLAAAFGKENVFKDVDNIPPGRDFRGVLREATADCDVMLVVIGPNWLNMTDAQGKRRLDDPNDFVRLEVETGLQRDGTLVIPLLIEGASMPSAGNLPDVLKELAYNNAFIIHDDPLFHQNMDTLIRQIKGQKRRRFQIDWRWWVAAIIIPLVAALITILPQMFPPTQVNTPTPEIALTTAVPQVALVTDEPSAISETPPEIIFPTTIPPDAITPTLSGLQLLGTTEAQLTLAAETQAAINLTATQNTILSANATATASQLALTETSAYATLFALSATPTLAPTSTIAPQTTEETIPLPQTTEEIVPEPQTTEDVSSSQQTPLELALEQAWNFTGKNDDWKTLYPNGFVQTFNGVEMVLVPKGCFDMGSNDGDNSEKPVNEQCFDAPFWIDKYEVTNVQYGSIGCEQWSSEPNQPRNCVTWFEARDFCAARDARLPTEREWEYAARGVSNWVYPWGDDFIGENVVYSENSGGKTAPVGSRPAGAAWVGALDMSGNLWEWTSSWYTEYPYATDDGREDSSDGNSNYTSRVLRGGSWNDSYSDGLRAADRSGIGPNSNIFNIGFRCARSE